MSYSTTLHISSDNSQCAVMLSRKPQEGDFSLLMIQKRGPLSLPCVIRTATSIEHFKELIRVYFTRRAIKRISERTKTQSSCSAWFIYKRCVISGTMAKFVLNQNLKKINNEKLNYRLTRTFSSTFKTAAMEYGLAQEPIGIQTFFNHFKKLHINARFRTVGLTLLKEAPYIGGSPDGLVSCDCCPEPALIELKCPFRLAQSGITNWKLLEYLDDQQILRKNHTYYHQISLYMGIFDLKKTHFVVYAKGEIISQIVHFEKEFFDFQVKNLQEYYLTRYLPSVIGKAV